MPVKNLRALVQPPERNTFGIDAHARVLLCNASTGYRAAQTPGPGDYVVPSTLDVSPKRAGGGLDRTVLAEHFGGLSPEEGASSSKKKKRRMV